MVPGRPLRSPIVARREGGGRVTSWLALVLVCASVAGQLASFAHLALVRHSVCAEHGELIHSDDAGQDHAAAGAAVASGVPGRAAFSIAHGADAAHTHEHCLLVTGRREHAVHRAAVTFEDCAGVQQVLAVVVQPAAAVAPAVFAYAPKCSPPA
jgi:hypothetical protein